MNRSEKLEKLFRGKTDPEKEFELMKQKAEIKQYEEKLKQMLKDPVNQKKAALIIEEMLKEKPQKKSNQTKDDSKKSA
ncbi:MAG: hypothetical protein GY909_13965 [Oligoflexia bacterium]|nr:hypothetical protein [Oligoflexia bacterium]